MAESNWQKIKRAPTDIPVLLRIADPSIAPFLGHQDENGRWWTGPGVEMVEPLPAYFCLIPEFDFSEGGR